MREHKTIQLNDLYDQNSAIFLLPSAKKKSGTSVIEGPKELRGSLM